MGKQIVVRTYPPETIGGAEDLKKRLAEGYAVVMAMRVTEGVNEYILEKRMDDAEVQE